jgi:hypothetical protein
MAYRFQTPEPKLTVQVLNIEESQSLPYIVLCGEACVHSFLAQNLASLHTAKP